MKPKNKEISKFLSLILRHNPDKINLELDDQGWAQVDELIEKSNKYRFALNLQVLNEVVTNNDKQRFSFNEDKTKIRANQGHSIIVDLNFEPQQPPEFLYHGTVAKFLDSIKEQGLLKMNRHHVHLSDNRDTATKVGARRGKPIILSIRSGEMYRSGVIFFKSKNGVWLTDCVLPEFINFKN